MLCQAQQPLPLAQGVLKEIAAAPFAQQRHCDRVCLLQKDAQNVLFKRRKIGKAVHIHVLPRGVAGGSQLVPQLKSLKIPYVILKQESIEGICKSITELGRICGSEAIAERMVKNILSEVGSLRAKVKGKARPSVMVCVSRELSEPVISTIYIAGQNNFYNELIDIAGGVNVSKERRIAYPQVSPDGISKMNPNIIIDLVGDKSYYHSKDKIDLETIFSTKYLKNQWMRSVSADAVKRGRIAVMNGTVYLRPGPRVGEVLRSFAEAIHPEIKR